MRLPNAWHGTIIPGVDCHPNKAFRLGSIALAQPINTVGSQQALENNWNDENAVQKFERARESASREHRDKLFGRPRPNAVELGVGTAFADNNFGPGTTDKDPLFFTKHTAQPSARHRQTRTETTSVLQSPSNPHLVRYAAGPAILVCTMLLLAIGLYFA
jgi:hypothetical protein